MPNDDYTDIAFGVLFRNDRKQQGSKQPDYTGNGEMPDGTKVKIAAWVKEKNGRKFFAWNVQKQPADKQSGQSASTSEPANEDVPF